MSLSIDIRTVPPNAHRADSQLADLWVDESGKIHVEVEDTDDPARELIAASLKIYEWAQEHLV